MSTEIAIPDEIREHLAAARLGMRMASIHERLECSCAAESVITWVWKLTGEAGDSDPEQSPVAESACRELGISYEDLLELESAPAMMTFNSNLKWALQDGSRDRLLHALAMILAHDLAPSGSYFYEVDWTQWEKYDTSATVQIPRSRGELMAGMIVPFDVLSCICRLALNPVAPITSIEDDVRLYFKAHQTELYIARST